MAADFIGRKSSPSRIATSPPPRSDCTSCDCCSSSPESPSSIRRPATTVPWPNPKASCLSERVRPSTAVAWESKRCANSYLGPPGGRRFSAGTRGCSADSPPLSGEGRRWSMGGSTSSQASSPKCSGNRGSLPSLLDLVQSNKKSKEKFKLLIRRLMQHETEVNCTGEHNMTPLHFAVLSGDKLAVEALVGFGASVNAKNSFNQTPLDVATENQQDHLVPLLVSIGCKRGRDIPELSPHHPTPSRSRAVSSPHEAPRCRKLSSPHAAPRGSHSPARFDFDRVSCCSSEELMKRSNSDLSEQLDTLIDRKFEATESLTLDEYVTLAMQKHEIARFKSKYPSSIKSASSDPMIRCVGGSRILSLDGGGVRALIQVDILHEIEQLTGKRVTELFDWIIGSSAGGILALVLVYRRMPLSRLRKLFFKLKEEVFSKGRVGICYDTDKLEEMLKEELGANTRLGDIKHPKVMVCAVDKSSIPLKLNFFNNCFDDEFSQELVWKVARYTSAAPLYFTECDNYVDGGVIANNPCIDGLTRIQAFYRERNIDLPIACMVSLGSGLCPTQELGPVDFHVFLRLKFAGMFKKVHDLITMLSSAIGESETLAERCRANCELQKIPFFRFNPQLGEKIDPGVTDNHKLLRMLITTRIYTHTQEAQLDKLLSLLERTEDTVFR